MSELLKYDKQGKLVEVVEFSAGGNVETLHALKGVNLLRYWLQEVDGEMEKFVEHIKYKDQCSLSSMRMNGHRWTRAVLDGAVGIEYPEVEDRVTTSNGEFIALKINKNILEAWKEKIINNRI